MCVYSELLVVRVCASVWVSLSLYVGIYSHRGVGGRQKLSAVTQSSTPLQSRTTFNKANRFWTFFVIGANYRDVVCHRAPTFFSVHKIMQLTVCQR